VRVCACVRARERREREEREKRERERESARAREPYILQETATNRSLLTLIGLLSFAKVSFKFENLIKKYILNSKLPIPPGPLAGIICKSQF